MPGISAGIRTTSGTPEATAMVHTVTRELSFDRHRSKFHDRCRGYRLILAQFNGYTRYVKAQAH